MMSEYRARERGLEELRRTLIAFRPSPEEMRQAVRIGELVTQQGYRLWWLPSQRWVVQLSLDFLETKGPIP